MRRKNLILIGISLYLAAPIWGYSPEQPGKSDDPFTTWNLFTRAKRLVVPKGEQLFGPDTHQREWDFSAPDRGNFMFFDNTDKFQVSSNKTLTFTLTDKPAVLGWGNFGNRLLEHQKLVFWKTAQVRFKARQVGSTNTLWKLACYYRGVYQKPVEENRKVYGARDEARLEGNDWQTLSFKNLAPFDAPGVDAFSIEISGAAGTRIEIQKLEIARDYYAGCFRKEFIIPEGKIWRAVADVGKQTVLYINGQEVPSGTLIMPRPLEQYNRSPAQGTEQQNLAPYLKPGRNVIALSGGCDGLPPNLYLRGSVVMENGALVELNTDETWKWAPRPVAGWTKAGFDDSAWKCPDTKMTDLQAPHNFPSAQAIKGWRLYLESKTGRPVYGGRLIIENPDDNKLFFPENKPLTLIVRIPQGLAARTPALAWQIQRYDQGALVNVDEGTCGEYTSAGADLKFLLKPGQLKRGVYLLALDLRAKDGTLIEQRIPEPLVVVGRLPMREVAGDAYEEGLQLELECDLDFTQPDNPACEWVEADATVPPRMKGVSSMRMFTADWERPISDPIIVTRNSLKYRETRPQYGAQYSYLVKPVKHPGDWYLFVLDYPDDAERIIGVSCNSEMDVIQSKRCTQTNKSGASVMTGNRYPLSRMLKQLKWLYRPDAGATAINVQSLMKDTAAAAARLRVYRIANGLPALRVPDQNRRWLGYLTESGTSTPFNRWSNLYHMFGFRKTPLPTIVEGFAAYDDRPAEQMCAALADWLDAAEHYVEYLRFSGQNFHVLACLQYNDTANPYTHLGDVVDSRIENDFRDVLARCFRENGIDFLASVEFCGHSTFRFTDDPRTSMATYARTGQAINVLDGFYGADFNHPRVREVMLGHAREIADKFSGLSNFRGINWTTYPSDWLPAWRTDYLGFKDELLAVGYGDATIRKFETETGVEIPGIDPDDPNRFEMRYEFLTSETMRPKWIQWRCQALKDVFGEIGSELRRHRNDLIVTATPVIYGVHVREWQASNLPLAEFMRLNGWDARLFKTDPRIWLTHLLSATTKYEAARRKPGYAAWWDLNVSPDFYGFFNSPYNNRSVHIQHNWLEMERFAAALPYRQDWARPGQATMEAHAGDEYACEVYAQALIGADPNQILYGFSDAAYCIGFEQPLREFNRVFRVLPAENFVPFKDTGFQTNLAIRQLRKDGKLLIYVVNPGYWPIDGQLSIRNANEALDMVTGKPAAKRRLSSTLTVPVSLKPYGVVAFEVPGKEAEIVDWDTKPVADKDLAHLRGIIDQAAKLMANPPVKAVLTDSDADFMNTAIDRARDAIVARRYALAWSIVTDSKFWTLWKDYLEKQRELAENITERDIDPLTVTAAIRSAVVSRAVKPPKIDGRLDDPAWKQAQPLTGFVEQKLVPAKVGTIVYAVWRGGDLYLAYVCKDNFPDQVRKTASSEGQVLSSGDDVAIFFLQPDPAKPNYVQMGFNPAGVKFDQRVISKDRDYGFSPKWEVATVITKDGWVGEARIPAAELGLGGKLEGGAVWRGNFCRLFRFQKVPPATWSYMPADWHCPEKFGILNFTP